MLLPYAPEQGEEESQWPQDLQPPLLPGPQEKSSGDERPATEPLFKVLDTPLSEGDEPTTLPAQRDHEYSVQMEGYLGRKHDLEGPNKKASNRCVREGPPGGEVWAPPRDLSPYRASATRAFVGERGPSASDRRAPFGSAQELLGMMGKVLSSNPMPLYK